MLAPWTTVRGGMRAKLDEIRPSGGTALYDALDVSLPLFASRMHPRAAILLVSDGADTASDTTPTALKQKLVRSDVFLYAIGIDSLDEKRDPAFETKMREVLMVYREVMLQNRADPTAETAPQAPAVITVSIDEKPGVQALANTTPDLPPVAGQYPQVARDHEYTRHGTLSILASLDLHDGHIVARVEPRHRSREFVALLKELDAYYPPGVTIRIILDNHSAHISKETRAYLATRPNRFKNVYAF